MAVLRSGDWRFPSRNSDVVGPSVELCEDYGFGSTL